ncbi:MAG: hypothetical protein WC838_03195 [Candidatus Margulisiibacteriota bacterium]|jgi:hypothetical protein
MSAKIIEYRDTITTPKSELAGHVAKFLADTKIRNIDNKLSNRTELTDNDVQQLINDHFTLLRRTNDIFGRLFNPTKAQIINALDIIDNIPKNSLSLDRLDDQKSQLRSRLFPAIKSMDPQDVLEVFQHLPNPGPDQVETFLTYGITEDNFLNLFSDNKDTRDYYQTVLKEAKIDYRMIMPMLKRALEQSGKPIYKELQNRKDPGQTPSESLKLSVELVRECFKKLALGTIKTTTSNAQRILALMLLPADQIKPEIISVMNLRDHTMRGLVLRTVSPEKVYDYLGLIDKPTLAEVAISIERTSLADSARILNRYLAHTIDENSRNGTLIRLKSAHPELAIKKVLERKIDLITATEENVLSRYQALEHPGAQETAWAIKTATLATGELILGLAHNTISQTGRAELKANIFALANQENDRLKNQTLLRKLGFLYTSADQVSQLALKLPDISAEEMAYAIKKASPEGWASISNMLKQRQRNFAVNPAAYLGKYERTPEIMERFRVVNDVMKMPFAGNQPIPKSAATSH